MKKIVAVWLLFAVLLSGFCAAEADEPGRALTQEELTALTDSLDYAENGFFLSTYDRPEEIDWHQVFYNGAGLAVAASEEVTAYYESLYGELYTDLTVVPNQSLEDFVMAKTGTAYRLARRPVSSHWSYVEGADVWIYAHGDTNIQSIEFVSGTVDGEVYRLHYFLSSWEEYSFGREYIMTAVIQDGNWQYISNLPADAPAPVTLMDIQFCGTLEQAGPQYSILETYEYDPAYTADTLGWHWAVITARTDNVRYILEQVSSVFEVEDSLVPGDYIGSGVLNTGESIAVYVNSPWFPEVRLSASSGAFWGNYCFGEDIGLPLLDSDPRYITGHDLAGEGRGCSPRTEDELARFLTDGPWIYLDEQTGQPLATVSFPDFWDMDITTVDEAYPVSVRRSWINNGEYEAPDMLIFERGYAYECGWSTLPDWYTADSLGDYMISAVQLDGEQLLYLTQANNGEAALGYLLPNAGENVHEFILHRFRGTEVTEGQGTGTEEGQGGWDLSLPVMPESEPEWAEGWEYCYWESTEPPFLVKAYNNPVIYYAGPGFEYGEAGRIEEPGIFTIVELQEGSRVWGKLKSGAGWLYLYDVELYEG